MKCLSKAGDDMNIRQMKYCLEIYRAGSLQKAAQNLGLSQPALTQQLQRVEKELGVRIFNRDARPIALTREGELSVASFEKMVFEYERLGSRLADMRSLLRTEITIGIPPVRAQQFLPLLIPAFRAAYPQIRINYREIVSGELPAALKSGEIDLAVMILEEFTEGLQFVPMGVDRSVLVAKRLSPYAAVIEDNVQADGSFDFRHLRDVPFILLPKGAQQRRIADAIFEKYEISPPVIMESRTVELAVKLAALGEGCTICGETYLYFSKIKNLDVLSLDREAEAYRFGIASLPENKNTRAVQVFTDFCRDVMKGLPFSAAGN